MAGWEYRLVPAPREARRIKGVRGTAARFAATVAAEINAVAAEGWEFAGVETLPLDARKGLLGGRAESLQSLLVFRRPLEGAVPAARPLPRVAEPVAEAAAEPPGPVPRIELAPREGPGGGG